MDAKDTDPGQLKPSDEGNEGRALQNMMRFMEDAGGKMDEDNGIYYCCKILCPP